MEIHIPMFLLITIQHLFFFSFFSLPPLVFSTLRLPCLALVWAHVTAVAARNSSHAPSHVLLLLIPRQQKLEMSKKTVADDGIVTDPNAKRISLSYATFGF